MTLPRALARAEDFESAAGVLLEHALADVTRALAPTGGKALRGVVWHRPERGAHAIAVRDLAPSPARALPSGTAWRWIGVAGEPVCVDVEARRVHAADGERLDGGLPGEFESRAALLGRDATHVLAAPLRRGGGVPEGMVCVEVQCRDAVGGPPRGWPRIAAALRDVADAGATAVAVLPRRAPTGDLVDPLLPVVGASTAAVVRLLATFATLDETVLLRGPTGTGKSHLARWVHARSGRAAGPFVTVQLHAVPEGLREGELFGWKRGAFTGAVRDHAGAVERADRGTLFLDEVDKLPVAAQGKLLRLLEERRYVALGDVRERRADVRFVVATNADLEREVREGRFLPDLYYRVNVLPTEVPALARRRDEIGAWARFMLAQVAPDTAVEVDAHALALLAARDWPGNLRQLHAVLLRAWAFARASGGEPVAIGAAEVTRAFSLDGPGGAGDPLLAAMERAAAAFVEVSAARVAGGDPPLPFEHADAFAGMVLEAAIARHGDPRAAFAALGLEERLAGGNHLKSLRREQDKVRALAEILRG